MQTRIGIFCDRLLEAGWLTAAVVVPLFFNSYAPRAFDAPKTILIRSIALLMLLAWLGKWAGEQGSRGAEVKLSPLNARSRGSTSVRAAGTPARHVTYGRANACGDSVSSPLLGPRDRALLLLSALLLGTVYVATTLTSIAPRLSLWGSYQRLQGTYTTLSYIVIFLLTAHHLRRSDQVQRLVTAILLTSWPVCLFGLAQQLGLDPIAWTGEERAGIFSTQGHPLYLAAYLIMVIPLTVERLLRAVEQNSATHAPPRARWVLATGLAVLLSLQLVSLVLTQSRAPTLGLIAGLLVMFLVWAYRCRRRALAFTVLAVGLEAFLLLILLNLPNTPFPGARETIDRLPYLGRISRIFEAQSGSGLFRITLWNNTAELMAADPSRLILGYGPETYAITILPYYPQPLLSPTAERLPDRAHNETFDLLATTGLLGLVVYLLLFGAVLYAGLQNLGVVHTRRQRTALAGSMALAMVAGAIVPRGITGNWSLSGLGISLGLVTGFLLFLIGRTLTSRQFPTVTPGPPAFLSALLAAVVAHLVEISFGIAIPTTRLYFWLFAAVIAGAARLEPQPESLAPTPVVTARPYATTTRHSRTSSTVPVAPDSRPVLATLLAMVLITLAFDMADVYQFNLTAKNYIVPLIILGTWVAGSLIETSKIPSAHRDRLAPLNLTWPSLVIAGGLFAAYALSRAPLELATHDAAVVLVHYTAWIFMLAVVLALVLPGPLSPSSSFLPRLRMLIYGLLILVFVTVSWWNLRLIQADVYLTLGRLYAEARDWDRSLDAFRRALSLAPDESFYYQHVAQMYLDRSNVASESAEKEMWLQRGAANIDRARLLNPLFVDQVYNSAQYYLFWAQLTREPRLRQERLDLALDFCQQAAQMFPANPDIYTTCGLAYQFKGDYDRALAKYQHALKLKPDLAQAYLYIGNTYLQGGKPGEAAAAYQQALNLNPNLVDARRGLAQLYLEQGDAHRALEEARRVVELAPDDFTSHRDLAIIYRKLGEWDQALSEATAAWNRAPSDQRPVLANLIEELKARR